MSDAQVLAQVIFSSEELSRAERIAAQMLLSVENSLEKLGSLSVDDLMKFDGIGKKKAMAIAAVFEIARRTKVSDIRQKPRITCSRDAYNAICAYLAHLGHEEFWLLLLNRANEVFTRIPISLGGTSATVVDLKIVFNIAIQHKAAAMIAVHNHPSGNLDPSRADIDLTERIKAAGKIMDLPLLDHLIVSERGYYSFADEGLI